MKVGSVVNGLPDQPATDSIENLLESLLPFVREKGYCGVKH